MELRSDEITGIIRSRIEGLGAAAQTAETGTVAEVGDGILRIFGADNCMAGELLELDGGIYAMALNLEQELVGAAVLGSDSDIREGDTVRRTGRLASITAGEAMCGRVINALGEPIDGKGTLFSEGEKRREMPIERPAMGIMTRGAVNRPLFTGIKAIDSMIPIGKGQRELIIGDRQTGKTALALDAVINQRDKNVICVYAAIGQKRSSVAAAVKTLSSHGALGYTVIVSATASEPAALQYIAPYSAAAICEYFLDKGKDVLCVYDDLSKHAVAYRTLSLLLRRPPGREAYPGDVFYLHSRLLERACSLDKEHGGGSVTALPIIETQAGDVSSYIPTNVISITDGQIFLDTELFNAGIRPAVNPGISVSRVGGAAQIKAMKRLSGSLKLTYSQYRELAAFSRFTPDIDPETRRRLRRGECVVSILRQGRFSPVSPPVQVAVIYAAVNGYLDDIAKEDIPRFEELIKEALEGDHRDIADDIMQTGELAENTEERLSSALSKIGKGFSQKLIGE